MAVFGPRWAATTPLQKRPRHPFRGSPAAVSCVIAGADTEIRTQDLLFTNDEVQTPSCVADPSRFWQFWQPSPDQTSPVAPDAVVLVRALPKGGRAR